VNARPVPDEFLIHTRYGSLKGRASNGVGRFLGIPYAAPPVGPRRLALPQPPQAWTGVRDATARGANAPQIIRAFPGLDVTPLVGHGWSPGDDFLTLNIWTPHPLRKNLPVLVFIHGGAFVGGSSDAAVHDGAAFARDGVLCVTINYRLGVEGFLPIAGVPTNLGLRDQIAAIQWVTDNIESFGGDAANITIAGESAGAMCIASLIGSPLGAGLIRRAIVQSGHGSMVRPLEVAARLTQRVAAHLGVNPDREGFSARSFEQCAAAVDAMSRPEAGIDLRDGQGRDAAYGLSRFLPVYGDDLLPQTPLIAMANGAGSAVELLIGTTREEMNIYLVPTGVKRGIDAASARRLLGASEPAAPDILTAYGIEDGDSAGAALAGAMTDLVFRLPARHFAAIHRGRAHLYEFGWRSPACNGELGACHALELPFVFDTLETCTGPAGIAGTEPPQALSDRIHRIWVDFVTSGALPWSAYDAQSRQCMALETGIATRDSDMPAAVSCGYLPR
jgi:para-nitrobenzyl esterase